MQGAHVCCGRSPTCSRSGGDGGPLASSSMGIPCGTACVCITSACRRAERSNPCSPPSAASVHYLGDTQHEGSPTLLAPSGC